MAFWCPFEFFQACKGALLKKAPEGLCVCFFQLFLPSRFWSRGSAERIWGWIFNWSCEFLENCRKFLSEFFQRFFSWIFRCSFSSVFRPSPKNSRPTVTSKIVGIPLQIQICWTQKCFTPIFCLRGTNSKKVILVSSVGTCHVSNRSTKIGCSEKAFLHEVWHRPRCKPSNRLKSRVRITLNGRPN